MALIEITECDGCGTRLTESEIVRVGTEEFGELHYGTESCECGVKTKESLFRRGSDTPEPELASQ